MSEVGEAAKPDELDELTVVVGPEGGLTREESCRLRDSGFCAVRFGEHILRVETAAVAVSAAALMTMQRSMSSRSGKTST